MSRAIPKRGISTSSGWLSFKGTMSIDTRSGPMPTMKRAGYSTYSLTSCSDSASTHYSATAATRRLSFSGCGKKRPARNVVDRAIASVVNILSVIYAHFYFCTYSNSLKDIGRLLGVKWTDDASAIQSIVWRIRWQRSQD